MLKEDVFVEIIVTNYKNVEYYNNLGYVCKLGDTISINQKHLSSGSRVKIRIICDYCGKEYETQNKSWQSNKRKQILKKDACCHECRSEYIKESNIEKYGYENVFQVEEFKKKQRETNLKLYGVEYISQSPQIQDKIKSTCLEKYGADRYAKTDEYKVAVREVWKNKSQQEIDEIINKREKTSLLKYGVKNPTQAEEVKEKAKNTNLKKYGCENVFQNEEIKEKIRMRNMELYGVEHNSQTFNFKEKTSSTWQNKSQEEIYMITKKRRETCLKKYGVESPLQNKEILEKVRTTNLKRYNASNPMKNPEIRKKALDTLNKNGSIAISKQQRYIQGLIGGTLNYYTGYNFLDIAFEDEKIYVEYDGGGHNLDVKLGSMTEEEFRRKEMKRYFALKNKGWKCIKIISNSDKLPYDNVIIKMIEDCRKILNNDNWVTLDIDKGLIITFDNSKVYDFGELRYLRKEVA